LWAGLIWLRIRKNGVGSFKHGNESSGFTKDWKFLDYLRLLASQEGLCLMGSVKKEHYWEEYFDLREKIRRCM